MIQKLGLSAALALVFAVSIVAGAMAQSVAQSPSSTVPASYNDAAKPSGASTFQPPVTGNDDAAKPSGASTTQIPMDHPQTPNKP